MESTESYPCLLLLTGWTLDVGVRYIAATLSPLRAIAGPHSSKQSFDYMCTERMATFRQKPGLELALLLEFFKRHWARHCVHCWYGLDLHSYEQ
jgi:hypothetical protein